jgi:hypothetical protein
MDVTLHMYVLYYMFIYFVELAGTRRCGWKSWELQAMLKLWIGTFLCVCVCLCVCVDGGWWMVDGGCVCV